MVGSDKFRDGSIVVNIMNTLVKYTTGDLGTKAQNDEYQAYSPFGGIMEYVRLYSKVMLKKCK